MFCLKSCVCNLIREYFKLFIFTGTLVSLWLYETSICFNSTALNMVFLYPPYSGGYYGFDCVPPPPPCENRTVNALAPTIFLARAFKFAGYVYPLNIFSGNIFGLVLKNKMATRAIFPFFSSIFLSLLLWLCYSHSSQLFRRN